MGLNQERSSKEQEANSITNSVYNEAQGIEPPAQVEPSTRTNLWPDRISAGIPLKYCFCYLCCLPSVSLFFWFWGLVIRQEDVGDFNNSTLGDSQAPEARLEEVWFFRFPHGDW